MTKSNMHGVFDSVPCNCQCNQKTHALHTQRCNDQFDAIDNEAG